MSESFIKRKSFEKGELKMSQMKIKRKSAPIFVNKLNEVKSLSSISAPQECENEDSVNINNADSKPQSDVKSETIVNRKTKGRPRKYPAYLSNKLKKTAMKKNRRKLIKNLKLPKRLIKSTISRQGQRTRLTAADKLELINSIEQSDIHSVSNASGYHINTLKYWVDRKDQLQQREKEERSSNAKNGSISEDSNKVPENVPQSSKKADIDKTNSPISNKKLNNEKPLSPNKKTNSIDNLKILPKFNNITLVNSKNDLTNLKSRLVIKPITSNILRNSCNIVRADEIMATMKYKIRDEIKRLLSLYDKTNRDLIPLVQYFSSGSNNVNQTLHCLYTLITVTNQNNAMTNFVKLPTPSSTPAPAAAVAPAPAPAPAAAAPPSSSTTTEKPPTLALAMIKLYEYYKGEYQLLEKIASEYRTYTNESSNSKPSTNDLEDLKNYFTFSINRLKELFLMIN